MHRRAAVLLASVAGCSPPERAPPPPPPPWVYAPAAVPLLGPARGHVGRSQAPQPVVPLGIAGEVRAPLRLATPWTVPGDGPARAVVYGLEGTTSAIELIDVDAGRVLWRDTEACHGPVVGVTADAIVCADANGARGVGLDGRPRWASAGQYIARSDDRVVMAAVGEAIVLDAATGDELARVKLPAGVMIESVLASCGDAGRELFAAGQDGALTRVAEAKGGPAVSWATPVGRIDELDACTGETIVVREAGVDGGALVAIERATGKITGRVDGVHGYWPARDGSDHLEIATRTGTGAWPRTLVGPPVVTTKLPLGELLAERGDHRLVRTSPRTAVLLDRAGVRAYLAFAAMGAVLGDAAIIGASWTGSEDHRVRRIAIPARYRKALRLPGVRPPVAVPAELRDLPPLAPVAADATLADPDHGRHAVLDVAIDPREAAILYTLQLERADDETGMPSVASADLAARAWRWHRADACGTGQAIGFAVAREVIACATRTRTAPAAVVRATTRDGAAAWEWEGDGADRLEAAGDAVLVFDADRAIVLDAATGKRRGTFASADGGPMPATVVAVGDTTFVVAAEQGRVVARLAGAMLPVWSIAVDGVVDRLTASADGVLVALEDGDAYRLALPEGTVYAIPGLNLTWRAAGDLVAAYTAGGPVPGPPVVAAPARAPRARARRTPRRRIVAVHPERPRLWTPVAPPPSLGDSWQLTLYELAGGLRARNDYALVAPIAPARVRGPTGSPLVVASSPGLREVLVIDPRAGAPVRRVQLGEDAAPGLVFGTIIDGTPVAGAVLQAPLRVVVF